MKTFTRHLPSWFETVYKYGIAIKGFDGLVEFATGMVLVIAPGIVHLVLRYLFNFTHTHNGHTFQFIAQYIARLDAETAKNGTTFLAVFLIGHGIVKLVLVYCLLRRILWAYPYALAVLTGFLVYQVYILIRDPTSIAMWLFTILDVAIIYLVFEEARELRRSKAPRDKA